MHSRQIRFKHWIVKNKLLLNVLVNVQYDHFHKKAIINNSNAAGVQIQSNIGPSVSNLPLIGLWNTGDGSPVDWRLMRSNTCQLHSLIVTKSDT